jgi:hypothetical protein
MPTVSVKVVEAKDIAKMDIIGHCDPFFLIKMGNQCHQTSKKHNCKQATYNETFTFEVPIVEELHIEAMDKDDFKRDDHFGHVSIQPSDGFNGWVELKGLAPLNLPHLGVHVTVRLHIEISIVTEAIAASEEMKEESPPAPIEVVDTVPPQAPSNDSDDGEDSQEDPDFVTTGDDMEDKKLRKQRRKQRRALRKQMHQALKEVDNQPVEDIQPSILPEGNPEAPVPSENTVPAEEPSPEAAVEEDSDGEDSQEDPDFVSTGDEIEDKKLRRKRRRERRALRKLQHQTEKEERQRKREEEQSEHEARKAEHEAQKAEKEARKNEKQDKKDKHQT